MTDSRIPRRTFLASAVLSSSAILLAACSSPEPATSEEAPSGDAPAASPVDDLEKGQGAILELDGAKVAVYKSDAGDVVKLSPKCPHQGCEVAWNDTDGVWDCPCHNSRFEADGTLVNGPATEGLKPVG